MSEIVEAEIVPTTPSPFRFGLQGLMIVMALCSVQFALMNYLGVLLGFFVGACICLVGMLGVMVVGIAVGKTAPDLFVKLDRLVIRLVLGLAAIVVSGALSGGGMLALQQLDDLWQVRSWELALGMHTKREVALEDDRVVQVLRIERVDPGQPADQAGLKKDDLFRPEPSVTEFYRNLKSYRGQDFDLTIYRGSSALNRLEDRAPIDVQISVPAK